MNQFLGQLALVGFSFAPSGWAFCNGQILPINQNQALFALIGTTFGGNGTQTFALPDLRSRVAVGVGNDPSGGSATVLGGVAGTENVTLLLQQLPAHSHSLAVSSLNQGTLGTPLGNTVGTGINGNLPYAPSSNGSMAAQAISNVGGSQAHENRSPFLVLNYIIALQGIFPSRN
jgi:microcystin-dependent protein